MKRRPVAYLFPFMEAEKAAMGGGGTGREDPRQGGPSPR